MININLLPVADLQQQFQGRVFLVGYGLFLVLAAVVLFGVKTHVMDATLARLAGERSRLTNSLNEARKKAAAAEEATYSTVMRWKQLAAILELEERRRDQTRLLVEIEELLPKTNAWLVGLTHQGGLMSLEGIATDKETVSQFLTNLDNAAYIDRASVTLVQISQDLVINGIKLTKFSLNARTNFPSPTILDTGLPEFGLPSRDEMIKAVRNVDEKLAADLTDEAPPAAAGRRRL
jgi:Tfp pilus assembly protein PilN